MTRRTRKISPRRRRLRYAGRRALWVAGLVVLLGALVLADRTGVFGRAPTPDREKYDGKQFRVSRVIDGDTLDLDIPDGRRHTTRVRLWGVDTPETVRPNTPPQHFGHEASRFTKDAAEGQIVRIELEPQRSTRDRYDRLLAYVYLPDGRPLNALLIEEGYGYADPRFDHVRAAEYRRLQAAARKARRGLWKDVTEADLPYYLRDKITLPGR